MGRNENQTQRLHHIRHPVCNGEKVKHLLPTAELQQILMLLINASRHGSISLQTNGVENVQLQIENHKIDLNLLQKEQIKTLLELEAKTDENSILKKLRTLKNTAEKLKRDGLTITISYKGQTMLTLGSEANPTVSQMVTETNAVEINNLVQLLALFK